jgi:hypothetical protein
MSSKAGPRLARPSRMMERMQASIVLAELPAEKVVLANTRSWRLRVTWPPSHNGALQAAPAV